MQATIDPEFVLITRLDVGSGTYFGCILDSWNSAAVEFSRKRAWIAGHAQPIWYEPRGLESSGLLKTKPKATPFYNDRPVPTMQQEIWEAAQNEIEFRLEQAPFNLITPFLVSSSPVSKVSEYKVDVEMAVSSFGDLPDVAIFGRQLEIECHNKGELIQRLLAEFNVGKMAMLTAGMYLPIEWRSVAGAAYGALRLDKSVSGATFLATLFLVGDVKLACGDALRRISKWNEDEWNEESHGNVIERKIARITAVT
jgi:hypothetical protein